jgi:hypothetical protein
MSATTIATTTSSSGVPYRRPSSRTSRRRPRGLGRGRHGAPHETQNRVRGWVGPLGGATEGAIGDIDEQHAEHVDNGFHDLDQRQPGGDRQAAQHERARDADHDHATPQLRRHEEVREQEREQEHVVERERALDQVDRRPLAGGAAGQRDPRRDRHGEHEPADAPDRSLAAPGRTAGRKQAQLDA